MSMHMGQAVSERTFTMTATAPLADQIEPPVLRRLAFQLLEQGKRAEARVAFEVWRQAVERRAARAAGLA